MEEISKYKKEIKNEFDEKICPECGGAIISIEERGDKVCSQCGLILEEREVDFSHSGRRAYTKQEKNSRERTGAPISNLLPDMGLTTTIDRKSITNPDLKRATKWNTRINWQKRNLLIATTELKRIASNLDLPNHVKQEAMRLYKEAFRLKLLQGRSINGMVAACLYYAVRMNKIPRTFQEILDESSANEKDVKRCYAKIIRELKLKVPNTNPLSYVPRFITDLGLDAEIESLTVKFMNKFKQKVATSGKDPKGIVAGSIYLACRVKDRKVKQKTIADTVGVTEVTLRSRYKEIAKALKINV